MTRRDFLRFTSLPAGLALVGVYPVFIERYIVLVNKYRIVIPRLPKSFDGFTIVHLTDFHYGPLVPYGFIEKVVQRANRIPRDMTLCTGDYIHQRNSDHQIEKIWPLISTLRAPYGVFSVLGNHDHWGDTDRSIYWLKKARQDLRHKVIPITRNGEKLWLVGAGDLWEDHTDIETLMATIPENECRIVLAHNPDSADTVFKSKVDLFLSGHTHGGQVNIPFIGTPVLPVKNKNYSFGLKLSPTGSQVFISRGIGWAIYPVRFNCFPEIAVITLSAEKGRTPV
jgi:predicted MPP superfamily phosphohydrolase